MQFVENTYSITIIFKTYLSRFTRYQDQPALTLRFWLPHWQYINQSGFKGHTVLNLNQASYKSHNGYWTCYTGKFSTRLVNSPQFWRTHSRNLNLYNPSYLSNIQSDCQLSRQDLHLYNSTMTQAIFQAIFDSMLNQLAKISTLVVQQNHKLSFKLYSIQC